MSQNKVQFRRSGEWTMVYLDGQLVKYGDHYLADEWLQARMGVEVVDDELGLCIPDGHHPIESLAEVEEAERRVSDAKMAAQDKRRLAAELLAEAETLEAQR